jgi:class 3 adenylate cyclase
MPDLRHVAFAVEDIDAVVARLRDRGAELVGALERYEDSYRADAICESLQIIRRATSLGSVETTIERRGAIPDQEHLPPTLPARPDFRLLMDNERVTPCSKCGAALPAEARFCPACATPIERAPEATEERKLATVLFADLVGSTALAGQRTRAHARDARPLLRRDGGGDRAGRGHGGEVRWRRGDGGLRRARCAGGPRGARASRGARNAAPAGAELFGNRLALRIGVNTGEVVVGRPREGSSFITGDAVNVGARLEQGAPPGEILVGERTAAAVRGAFELDEPTTIDAKGKPDGVVARRLLRALSLMRPRGVGGLRIAFVGREHELEELRTAYQHVVRDCLPQLAVIAGDAGVGKSRLVRELWAWLTEQEPQPLQRTGRCLSYGHDATYWPLGEVLREHFAILDSDRPEVVASRLGGRRHLGLTLGLDPDEELHPLKARERLHDAWAELLNELARERPPSSWSRTCTGRLTSYSTCSTRWSRR